MSDSFDMRRFLESWPFDPENDARIVPGDDGREVLQVRTPVGIEQLEMHGRPDGERPHGMETALDYHQQRLSETRSAGRETGFRLEPEACAELFAEGTLFYFRYLRLFQLRRWDETARDTARNLRLFDFVRQYAAREEDRNNLEKWRPYIVRMNAAATALMKLEKGGHDEALQIVRSAVARLENLDELDDETFEFEQERSLHALRELASQIERIRPVPAVEQLEQQLQRAVDRQEFERAAELRDRIRKLKQKQPARG